MATERISSARAGFVGGARIPCRWCGNMPEGSRKTFCSDECVHEHKLRAQPGYQAKHVLERDHGICCMCGRDCVVARERLFVVMQALAMRQVGHSPGIETRCHHPGTWGAWNCGHEDCADKAVHCALNGSWPDWRARIACMSEFVAAADAEGIPAHLRTLKRRFWEADHIVPVIEGGGDCGIENLRTLCWRCHKSETAALAGRRAKAKRPQQDSR
jgi:hypothetical protein